MAEQKPIEKPAQPMPQHNIKEVLKKDPKDNDKFIESMLHGTLTKDKMLPQDKRREMTADEQKNVDRFMADMKRGIIKK